MSLAVSSAKAEIAPSLAQNPYLGGYGCDATPRRASTDTPHAPLYARCIAFWDDGWPNVILSADVLAFPRSMHQRIRARALQLMPSSASSDFILAATHTHNGPVLVDKLDPFMAYNLSDLSQVVSYSSWLEDRIVELLRSALAAPRSPCTLDYQVTSADFASNREGLPYNETVVPVLSARGLDGHLLAILFSYGCHPVAAGIQTLFDGDWPTGACQALEQLLPGSFSLFLQGPAGDQDPVGVKGWALRDRLGLQLAANVSFAVNRAWGRPLGGPIVTRYQELDLPLDITFTPSNLAAVKAAYQARAADVSRPAWYRRHAQVMLDQLAAGSFARSVPLPLQVWQLQGSPVLQLALTGGELVSGYGVYFRQRYGGSAGLLIGGYANEIPAYIPSNELLPPIRQGGSYDGGWDIDFPGLAGGSMTVYGYLGHSPAGVGGVEEKLIAVLSMMLS